MRRSRPSIHVHHSQKSLGCQDYGYYDGSKNEIHILDKDALFDAVMRHELYHASQGLRWADGLRMLTGPSNMVIFIGGLLVTGTILFTIAGITLQTMSYMTGIAAGVAFVIMLSMLDYWVEEWKAKRAETDDSTLVPTSTLP